MGISKKTIIAQKTVDFFCKNNKKLDFLFFTNCKITLENIKKSHQLVNMPPDLMIPYKTSDSCKWAYYWDKTPHSLEVINRAQLHNQQKIKTTPDYELCYLEDNFCHLKDHFVIQQKKLKILFDEFLKNKNEGIIIPDECGTYSIQYEKHSECQKTKWTGGQFSLFTFYYRWFVEIYIFNSDIIKNHFFQCQYRPCSSFFIYPRKGKDYCPSPKNCQRKNRSR